VFVKRAEKTDVKDLYRSAGWLVGSHQMGGEISTSKSSTKGGLVVVTRDEAKGLEGRYPVPKLPSGVETGHGTNPAYATDMDKEIYCVERPDISSQLPLVLASSCNGTRQAHPTLQALPIPTPPLTPPSQSGKQASQPGSLKQTEIQADWTINIASHNGFSPFLAHTTPRK